MFEKAENSQELEKPIYYVRTHNGLKVLSILESGVSKEILDQIPADSHTWPVDKLSEGGSIEHAGWGQDTDDGSWDPMPATVKLGRRPTKEEFPSVDESVLSRSEATAFLLTAKGEEIWPTDEEYKKFRTEAVGKINIHDK